MQARSPTARAPSVIRRLHQANQPPSLGAPGTAALLVMGTCWCVSEVLSFGPGCVAKPLYIYRQMPHPDLLRNISTIQELRKPMIVNSCNRITLSSQEAENYPAKTAQGRKSVVAQLYPPNAWINGATDKAANWGFGPCSTLSQRRSCCNHTKR